jgi:hypothetical protein
MWWLFIVPSLRARKPLAQEKEALNWAFLATPLVSILMPFATKVSLQTRHLQWPMGRYMTLFVPFLLRLFS